MKKLKNTHPGEILQEDFLSPLGLSAYKLSKDIAVSQARVSGIIKDGKRITADTALRLSKYFGNSAQFWLNMQGSYDLEEERERRNKEYKKIKPHPWAKSKSPV